MTGQPMAEQPTDQRSPSRARSGPADVPSEPVRCSVCRTAVEGPPPLTWSASTGPLGTQRACAACTRRHLRSMEARLDEAYW